MTTFFKDLFDYNYQTNDKLSEIFCKNQDKVSEKAVKLFNHLLNAHQIWNNRIDPREVAFEVWQVHPLENLKVINLNNYQHTLQLLDSINLSKIINYTNTRGFTFNKSVQDILFHVINHATYHRGQIATEFKLHGLEPLSTDYILFKF